MFFKKKKKEKEKEVVNDLSSIDEGSKDSVLPSGTQGESTPSEVKKEKKKKGSRKWFRASLIILNATLATYLLYYVSSSAVDLYNTFFSQGTDSIYLLNGMTKDESMHKYNEAISKDDNGNFLTTDVYDYYIYGGYLHFSKNPHIYDNENFSSFDTYTLRDLSSDITYSSSLVFNNSKKGLNYGIPLLSLKKGDYIIYPYAWVGKGEMKPIKIPSENGIKVTLYTPIQNGTRRVIEILSKSSSPALLISVKNTYALESSYHDVSVLYNNDEEKEGVKKLFNSETQMDMILKSDIDSDNLISLYKSKATVNIIIDEGSSIKASHFLSLDESLNITSEFYDEGDLKGLDKDLYIRELGGYGFKAGSGYNEENQILYPYKGDHDIGRLTLRIGKDRLNDLPDILSSLLYFTF